MTHFSLCGQIRDNECAELLDMCFTALLRIHQGRQTTTIEY